MVVSQRNPVYALVRCDNPLEDYAESFARYFMDQAGLNFLDGTATGAPAKVDMIRSWASLVRDLGTAARPVGAGGTWGNPNANAGNYSGPNSAIVSQVSVAAMPEFVTRSVEVTVPQLSTPSLAGSKANSLRPAMDTVSHRANYLASTEAANWIVADSDEDDDQLLTLLSLDRLLA